MIIVGNTNIGKSSIMQRYVKKKFTANSTETVGVDFMQSRYKSENDEKCVIKIWDTCGQERYRSLIKSYFNSSDGIIIGFDLTNIQSFKDVTMWLNKADQAGNPGVPMVLVGNKNDLTEERQVDFGEAQHLANKLNLNYFETSAKTGDGIEQLMPGFFEAMLLYMKNQ